jgi:hypothetical protein
MVASPWWSSSSREPCTYHARTHDARAWQELVAAAATTTTLLPPPTHHHHHHHPTTTSHAHLRTAGSCVKPISASAHCRTSRLASLARMRAWVGGAAGGWEVSAALGVRAGGGVWAGGEGGRRAWMRTAAASSASSLVSTGAASSPLGSSRPPSPPRRPPMPDETRSARLGDFATDRPSGGITGGFAPARAALYLCSESKATAALVAPLAASGCLCAEEGVAAATGAAPASSSMPTISL